MSPRADVIQGTLDLMVLRTLDTLGPMHGWGIAQRLEQVSEDVLRINQGTLYPALLVSNNAASSSRSSARRRTTAARAFTASLPPDGGNSRPSASSGRSSPA